MAPLPLPPDILLVAAAAVRKRSRGGWDEDRRVGRDRERGCVRGNPDGIIIFFAFFLLRPLAVR